MLPCSKCLEENNQSMREKGYGFSFMGTNLQCHRHQITASITPATAVPNNWQPHFLEYNNSMASRKKCSK